jgi:hypothetical protein
MVHEFRLMNHALTAFHLIEQQTLEDLRSPCSSYISALTHT